MEFSKILFSAFDSNDVSTTHEAATANFQRDCCQYQQWRENFSSFWGRLKIFAGASCSTLSEDPNNDFTLVLSQVVFRHGARSPLALTPNVPQARYDEGIFAASLPHTDFDYDLFNDSGAKLEGLENSSANISYEKNRLEGGMKKGQVTAVGSHQCYELGLALRKRYMLKYKLLSPRYDERQVYFRSTYMQRTLGSLQGVVAGLYGVDHLRSTGSKPKFFADYLADGFLFPNRNNCNCLKEISDYAVKHLNHDPARALLMQRIEDKIGKDLPTNITMIRQDLICRLAHGRDFPEELAGLLDEMDKLAPEECLNWSIGLGEDRYCGLQLTVGRFHHHLLTNMEMVARGHDEEKLRMYSTHDTMIMPLLVALGCFNWAWPKYTSCIAYELWRHKKSGQYFTKVLFNGEEQKLAGREDTMIPYGEFKQFLSPLVLTPTQHKQLCSLARADMKPATVKHPIHYRDSRLAGGEH